MKLETLKFEVGSAYGKELPTPVQVETEVKLYEDFSEIPENERLTASQHVQAVNARIKASARAKATTDALDKAGIKRPDANDPATIRENMVKMIQKLHNVDEATARKILDATEAAAAAVSA